MAEKSCREGQPRRPSFRRSLIDHAEAGLPDEFLEALEQKRKQLDESIHKYVAAKEREYRQYEKDLKQQRKLAGVQENSAASKPRRTSSETTQDSVESPKLLGQQSSVVDTLLAAGLKREHIGQSVALAVVEDDGPAPTLEATKVSAGLTDRRASTDRNRDFVGVFTPAFLPALDGNDESATGPAHSSSALNSLEKVKRASENGVSGQHTDTMIGTATRRPSQLQLVQRSSSSGSSVDSKLTSALKSPTREPKPRRKRVSLAVGDAIVAPSDNVPMSMSNNSTPSHSRTRPSTSGRDQTASSKAPDALEQPQLLDTALAAAAYAKEASSTGRSAVKIDSPTSDQSPSAAASTIRVSNKIDPDGDLFDLENEDDALETMPNEDQFEGEDEVIGRLNSSFPGRDEIYDSNAGLISHDGHAEHNEFLPGSAVASQQPTDPGFRRPSASYDPVYRGTNYEKAETDAVNNEIYGSSFNRPITKASFTGGSLGESFMAQNAERVMRNRSRNHDEVS